MRALWLHYPEDPRAAATGDHYLWGRDVLVAPVTAKGATARNVFLPAGEWYDWWTLEKHTGGQGITRKVDLETLPLFVRAGSNIPLDPVRQYTAQETGEPTTLQIFPGADGEFLFYDDDGVSLDYLAGEQLIIKLNWDDDAQTLSLRPEGQSAGRRDFIIKVATTGLTRRITFAGQLLTVPLNNR
jgi:alpha-glucosidase/alpha-D-xyloside xylohydrolase